MPRDKHPDDGMVNACPECDRAGCCYRRVDDDAFDEHPYVCEQCGHEFDDPVPRESKSDDWDPSRPPPGVDSDGLPAGMDPSIKETILDLRGD